MIYLQQRHSKTETHTLPKLPGRYIYLSRELYSLYLFEIPRVEEKELGGLLEYRIRSMHPETSDKTSFDYRILKQKDGRRFALVAVSSRKLMEKLSKEYPNKTIYIPLFHMVDRKENRKGVSLHYDNPEKIKKRDIFLREPRPVLFTRNGVMDETVETDTEYFEDFLSSPPTGPGLSKVAKKPGYRGAFWRQRRSPLASFPARLVLYLLLFGALVLGTDLYRLNQREGEMAALRREYSRRVSVAAEISRLQAESEQLFERYTQLSRQASIQPWSLIGDLMSIPGAGDEADRAFEIIELRTEGNSFFLQARGFEALSVVNGFTAHPRFEDVRIYNILPVPDGDGRENFFISGEYFQ